VSDAPPGWGRDAWGEALGIEWLEVGPERVRARLLAGARHEQPYGILHGGVYCSIVEGVASYGAGRAAAVAGQKGVVGVANQTDFVRSHSEGELLCEGEPLHVGRRSQLWVVRIRRGSDGKLVAHGQVRFRASLASVRIATWNVNGLRARLDFVLHWLRAREPDVVGLQELKVPDAQFPADAFAELGYRALTHGQKSWNGVAILSREPAKTLRKGLPGQEQGGARLLSAEVAGLEFTTVYVPNGKSVGHEDFPRKLAWLDALVEHVGCGAPGRQAVVCGDFNVVPAALDSWNERELRGHIFHTEVERARFAALLGAGFVDLFRERHPEEQAFSWWDYRGGAFHRGHGLRIDFLLATPPVAARVCEVTIDRDYRKKKDGLTASDHAPVFADLG
jgi:exodeoxyribonuclease-3